ncbi:MAG: hypothetical protein ABIN36_04735 [Ferruginibacter sp.]
MEINIVIFINLLLYAVVVSQPFIYMIALGDVQRNLQPNTYIELRKLLDKNFRKKYTWVIYTSLVSSTLLTVLCMAQPDCLMFITAAIAWIVLIMEIFWAVKGNRPINKIINSWTENNYPTNWNEYRISWFRIYAKRQIVNIIGFLSLLAGVVFG